MAMVTEVRDRVPYNRNADTRRPPKVGLCGRNVCYQPAAWVWLDKAGHVRHECNRHAGLPDHLEDGDERVREGLRRENNGLIGQRLAAIAARNPRVRDRAAGWMVQRNTSGEPVGMVWTYHASRT